MSQLTFFDLIMTIFKKKNLTDFFEFLLLFILSLKGFFFEMSDSEGWAVVQKKKKNTNETRKKSKQTLASLPGNQGKKKQEREPLSPAVALALANSADRSKSEEPNEKGLFSVKVDSSKLPKSLRKGS